MKILRFSILSFLICSSSLGSWKGLSQHISINKSPDPEHHIFTFGSAVNPVGKSLLCDGQSLLLNGQAFIPVMGEFHYARFDDNEWRNELLKMKAGGINIIASYIFWIHHEEEKRSYDWSGSRNLRKFVEICKELDLMLVLRIGPFCHGEVRNGGIPDWIINGPYKIRSLDANFIDEVDQWYDKIYRQVRGLLWKDGGPVVGVQLDNEYRGRWDYLKTLKDLAQNNGFDVPLYTRTGWPNLTSPATFGEILPLYGDYADGFWNREMTDMPGDYGKAFLFQPSRLSTVIATEQIPASLLKSESTSDLEYPYFTCELGGGMMSSYHRRINIAPLDVHAVSIVKIGSGSNLPGYYMYHGGTNPEGKLTHLNEMQNTPYMNHNDLPIKNYDFQTPLGQFGQVNDHFHWLRRTHMFLADFGRNLAAMSSFFPEELIVDARGEDQLRWSVRSNGESGYVFVNNYQRMRTLSPKKDIQFNLNLVDESLVFPTQALTIPTDASFFFPFNLNIEDLLIKYATAQPITKIEREDVNTVFLAAVQDVPVEILLNNPGLKIKTKQPYHRTTQGVLFKNLKPGKDCVIDVKLNKKKTVRIVVLDETTSLKTYKIQLENDLDYLMISEHVASNLGNDIYLEQWGDSQFNWSIYPSSSFYINQKKVKAKKDGLFLRFAYKQSVQQHPIQPVLVQQQEAGTPRMLKNGQRGVAEQPDDKDFESAAVWAIEGLDDVVHPENLFLKISYEGDVARLYADNKLIQDDFFHGRALYAAVKDLVNKKVHLKILPVTKYYPIYFQPDIRDRLKTETSLLNLNKLTVEKRNRLIIRMNQ